MSRAFNFCAGPAALPEAVLRQAQAELLEWGGERASVMEVSHRGAAFEALIAQAEADLLSRAGPGLGDALDLLLRWLHPELFAAD